MNARWLALPVLSLVLAACGGGSSTPQSSHATTSPAPSTDAGHTLTEAEMKRALLTLADMPTGYKVGKRDDSSDDSKATTACEKKFDRLDKGFGAGGPTEQDADFDGSSLGSSIGETLDSFSSAEQLHQQLAKFASALDSCPSFKLHDDDGKLQKATVARMSFPSIGDESFAYTVNVDANGFPVAIALVVARVDRSVMLLINTGLGGTDAKVTEQLARKAVRKLEAVTG